MLTLRITKNYLNYTFMTNIEQFNEIFWGVCLDYHKSDNVDAVMVNPFEAGGMDALLYRKCWIDTVQWHLEDIIRDPNIDPVDALAIKRRIDKSNQDRTDLVEGIDSYFLDKFKGVEIKADAKINTESPAWAIDRLSILALKIYHMQMEVEREGSSVEHKAACEKKLSVLLEQRVDLTSAISTLVNEMEVGEKYMKVYKQMKMYNDPSLNPVLYDKK